MKMTYLLVNLVVFSEALIKNNKMGIKLNKESYEKLIQEDIEVLNKYLPEHSLERKHIVDVLLESVKHHYPDKYNNRKYTQPVDKYDDEIYSVKDWLDSVRDGCFNNFDGSGYWVKDGMKSRDEVFSTPVLDATHVVWYNK